MNETTEASRTSARGFETVAVELLAITVVLAPVPFGATTIWTLCALQIVLAAAAVLWAVRGRGDLRLLWIPAGVVGVGLLQLCPMPDAMLMKVSPLVGQADERLSELGIERPVDCVSVCPGETWDSLRQGLILAMVLVAVANLARNARARRTLVGAIMAAGLIVLVLGVALSVPKRSPTFLGFHDMRGPIKGYRSALLDPLHSAGFGYRDTIRVGQISYTAESPKMGDTFGPYVVSNHFAGCMELTIPLAVGLLLAWPTRSRRGRWIAMGLAVFLPAGVLTVVGLSAGSRAGVASLMAGLLVVAWLTARKPIVRRAWGIALGLYLLAWAALFVTLATWRGEVKPEAGTLADYQMDFRTLAGDVQGRVDAWRTCGRMFLQSPWLGTGLGTFAELYPGPVDTRHRLYYAHNDYLQFAVEAGLLGLAVAGGVVVLLVRRIWAGRARLMASERRGVAAGLVGGMFAVLLHGLFDWNAHVPANALLAVVLLGILLAMTTREITPTDDTADDVRERDFRGRLAGSWPVRLAVAAAMGGCIAAAVVHATAQQQLMPLRRAVVHQRLPDRKLSASAKRQAIEDALPSALRAARLTPWSYRHAEELGKAHLHLSQGRPSAELTEARRWFRRVRALCPVETSTPTISPAP